MYTKTADEMRQIYVKRAEDDHNAEHRYTPEAERPVFDRDAAVSMALKAVPAGSEDTFWYGWRYCPETSIKTLQRFHHVDFNDAAFMRNDFGGTMFVTYAQDAGGHMVPLMISMFADNESTRTWDLHNAGIVSAFGDTFDTAERRRIVDGDKGLFGSIMRHLNNGGFAVLCFYHRQECVLKNSRQRASFTT